MGIAQGEPTSYGVVYSAQTNRPTLETGGKVSGTSISPDGHFSVAITGLPSNTSYYARVYAIYDANDVTYGDVKFFATRHTSSSYTLNTLSFTQAKPSFGEILVQVRDQDGKGVSYLENKDFQVWEDNELTASTETHSYIRKMDAMPFKIKTVLALDVTSSLNIGGIDGVARVNEAAKQLIASKDPNQEFAIVVFSGEVPQLIIDFTSDIEELNSKIDEYINVFEVKNTTALYDAYMMGIGKVPTGTYSSSYIERGYMVLFTDGNNETSVATLSQCEAAGRGSGKQVFVLGLGDVDATVLKKLASHDNNYYPLTNINELEKTFVEIQSDILRDANSLYLLNYLSPKRGGEHDLMLKINNNNSSSSANASLNAEEFESVQYGVYVNPYTAKSGVSIGAYGLAEGTTYSFADGDTLQAVTYWSDVVPQYEWTSSNPDVATVESVDFNKARLRLKGGAGTAAITVKDAGNYSYVQGGDNSTIAPSQAEAFQKSFTVDASGTLFVHQEAYHTVSFNTYGGIPVPANQHIRGGKVEQPSINPDRQGYAFAGWYTDATGSEAWNFETPVIGNVTLHAKWDALPELKVATAAPTSITQDSATLGGTIEVEGEGYTERGICYATSPNPTTMFNKVVVGGSQLNFSMRVGKLTSYTTYYARAYALNANDTVYGGNIVFNTRNADEYYEIEGYSGTVTTKLPSFVEALVAVKDKDKKGADYLENGDFILTEDGKALSSESHTYIRKMDAIPFKIQTVLMLDNSSSLGYSGIEQLKQAAVELVKSKHEKQEFAVYTFSDEAVLIQDFTDNVDTLMQRISTIKTSSSSTNLYGSYITGMHKLPAEYSTKDSIQKCFFVMISDGAETRSQYSTALENSAIAARGAKTAHMIGLGQDLNEDHLCALASSNACYPKVALSDVKNIFVQIQNDIMREANSFYNLTYLSAKREAYGQVKLRLTINKNKNSGISSYYEASFIGRGFKDSEAGVYLNAYQDRPEFEAPTGMFGIGMPDNPTTAQRGDTIPGTFSLPDKFDLQAVTYWTDVKPQYVWTSSDSSVLIVENKDFDRGILTFKSNEERDVVVTVKDITSYELVTAGKVPGTIPAFAPFYQRSIRIHVTPATAPIITTTSLPDAALGAAYEQPLTADGTAPITWAVDSGSMPAGLTLSAAGVISGTPEAVDTCTFKVKAMNLGGSDIKRLSITVGKGVGATVAAPTLASKTPNSITINAVMLPSNGQKVEYAINTAATVPNEWQDGTTFTGLKNATTYRIFARSKANSSYHAGAASAYLLVSTAVVPPTITTTSLPSGNVDAYYSETLRAIGDNAIAWNLYGGSLPNGLTLSESGIISGTPTESGTFNFIVQAANADGSDTKSLSIMVLSAGVLATPILCDFESGNSSPLVFANGMQTNKWVVGSATAYNSGNAAYISNNGSSNNYSITNTSIVHMYVDVYFTPSTEPYILTFDWKGVGESAYDYLEMFLLDTTVIPMAGYSLNATIHDPLIFNQQSTWQRTELTMNADYFSGTVQRLVFSWRNNGSGGSNPPIAIDNITIESSVAVTGVSLNKTTDKLTVGSTTQLIATVAPNNASNKAVTWESSHPDVATVSATGLVTAKAEGTTIITVTTEDGSKTATCTITVTSESAIVESEERNMLKFFPNPVINGKLIIEIPDHIESRELYIYDFRGRLLQTNIVNRPKTELNISNLPDGTYIIRIGEYSAKIVKQ